MYWKKCKGILKIFLHSDLQWGKNMIRTLAFSPAKSGFKSVISIFCCSVWVKNISLHFQTIIFPLIVIIQWVFCLHKDSVNSQCSTQRSDLIIFSLSGMTNWDRLNPEELQQRLQDASRNFPAKQTQPHQGDSRQPYHPEAQDRLPTEAKQGWAWSVPGWETSWEN